MFKIIGENNIWFYDAITNKILDKNQKVIYLPNIVDHYLLFYKYRKSTYYSDDNMYFFQKDFEPDIKNITDLVIQLGLNCNLKCIYCSQNFCTPDLPSKSDIDYFCQLLLKSKINWKNIQCIQLWGGEPLVYWKALIKIVTFIRENIRKFKGHFHITTNGILLDKKKLDFFLKYNVKIQLSHDGVNHEVQRLTPDPLKDQKFVELMNWFLAENWMGDINITFGPINNPNLLDSLQYFKSKLPNVQICCRSALRCDSTNKHLLFQYSSDNLKIAKESYYRVLTLQPKDELFYTTYPTRYRLYELCRHFIFNRNPVNILFNCPSKQRKELCFNLKGEYIPCHGSTKSMGFSLGSLDKLDICKDINFIYFKDRPMCHGCLYTQVCQGPCGMYKNIDALIHCKSTKWAWEAWFEAVWFTLFKERPIYIERV